MKRISRKTKVGLLLALIVLTVLLFSFSGCVAAHGQVTVGTGKTGTAAAAAMAAGEPWPAVPEGNMSSTSKKSITRAARD